MRRSPQVGAAVLDARVLSRTGRTHAGTHPAGRRGAGRRARRRYGMTHLGSQLEISESMACVSSLPFHLEYLPLRSRTASSQVRVLWFTRLFQLARTMPLVGKLPSDAQAHPTVVISRLSQKQWACRRAQLHRQPRAFRQELGLRVRPAHQAPPLRALLLPGTCNVSMVAQLEDRRIVWQSFGIAYWRRIQGVSCVLPS